MTNSMWSLFLSYATRNIPRYDNYGMVAWLPSTYIVYAIMPLMLNQVVEIQCNNIKDVAHNSMYFILPLIQI